MRIDFVKNLIANLSESEKAELGEFLKSLESGEEGTGLEETRFASGLYCPNCGSTEKVVRFGKRNGIQRYRCKDCSRVFTTTTNTVLEGTRKPIAVWKKYVECMLNGLSVRKSAAICGISKNQSFIWRHKILDAMSKNNDKEAHLRGIIEADETFFRISFKGSRNLPRDAHHRGEPSEKRGLSKDKVCVVCAVDREGAEFSKLSNLGKISVDDLENAYSGRIAENSIFCTDSEKAYRKFAKNNGYELIQIASGKHKAGVYHINHVNAMHSKMKKFMRRFNGVVTKYLQNYLSWFSMMNLCINDVIASFVKVAYFMKCAYISDRPSVPVN